MALQLGDFAGVWALSREISQSDGKTARFEGEALFTPGADGLCYDEKGTLQIAGAAPMQAERRYLWRASGERIAVFFADGRPFHSFGLTDTNADTTAAHWCDPDDYRVRYDFTGWPVWRADWRVKGPRKDYRMTSLYRRP